jgi:uncharacterized lipoprotein
MNFFKIPFVLLIIVVLSSCADNPSHLILAPELNLPTVIKYHNKQAQFNVTDLRTARHIIQVLHQGDAAELITSQQTLSDIIKQVLTKEFENQGLNIDEDIVNQAVKKTVNNKIDIIIDKALISVKQDTLFYEVKSKISVRIKVKNNQQTLTKTFNSSNNNTGSLTADVAVLERNFNRQLSNTLINLLIDDEVTQFIK